MLPARVRARRHVPARARGAREPARAGRRSGRRRSGSSPTILIHHRDGLTDLEVVETHWQIGEIAAKLGQTERAGERLPEGARDRRRTTSRRAGASSRVLEAHGRLRGRGRAAPAAPAAPRGGGAAREPRRDRRGLPRPAQGSLPGHRRVPRRVAARSRPRCRSPRRCSGSTARRARARRRPTCSRRSSTPPEVQADPVRAAKLHLALAEILRDEVKDEAAARGRARAGARRGTRASCRRSPRSRRSSREAEALADLEQAYVRMIQRLPKTPDAAQARVGAVADARRALPRTCSGTRTARAPPTRSWRAPIRSDAAALEAYAELAARKPGEEAEAIAALPAARHARREGRSRRPRRS